MDLGQRHQRGHRRERCQVQYHSEAEAEAAPQGSPEGELPAEDVPAASQGEWIRGRGGFQVLGQGRGRQHEEEARRSQEAVW